MTTNTTPLCDEASSAVRQQSVYTGDNVNAKNPINPINQLTNHSINRSMKITFWNQSTRTKRTYYHTHSTAPTTSVFETATVNQQAGKVLCRRYTLHVPVHFASEIYRIIVLSDISGETNKPHTSPPPPHT